MAVTIQACLIQFCFIGRTSLKSVLRPSVTTHLGHYPQEVPHYFLPSKTSPTPTPTPTPTGPHPHP
jgi:hypothetical protein